MHEQRTYLRIRLAHTITPIIRLIICIYYLQTVSPSDKVTTIGKLTLPERTKVDYWKTLSQTDVELNSDQLIKFHSSLLLFVWCLFHLLHYWVVASLSSKYNIFFKFDVCICKFVLSVCDCMIRFFLTLTASESNMCSEHGVPSYGNK